MADNWKDKIFSPGRPFWWPDAKGFLMMAIVAICYRTVSYRMSNPTPTEDKVLDMMITILFSTCLVIVYNYAFGSSSGKEAQDNTISKMAEKPVAVVAPVAPVAPVLPIAPIAPVAPVATTVTTVPSEPSTTPTTTTVTTTDPKDKP